jgi:hypothetical protein
MSTPIDDSFPARGVLIGLVLGSAMWAALGLFVWWCTR